MLRLKTFQVFKISKLFVLFISIFVLFISATAESGTYTVYVDTNVTDTYTNSASPDCSIYSPSSGNCGGGSAKAYRTLRDVNAFLNNLGTNDTATVYFKRGNRWIFTSNSDSIKINSPNVTLDAFGSGEKPVFDGNGQYPEGVTGSSVPYGYAISVGASAIASNISIKNLRIVNMYPGGGIIFSGSKAGKYFTGPGLIKGCEFENLGWAAINIYRVPNSGGAPTAIKIENNSMTKINEYVRQVKIRGWPQVINTNDGYSFGHECRRNVIYNNYGEGIGAQGFAIIEYNVISDSKAPSIYKDAGYTGDGSDFSNVIRYNLIWGDSDGLYGGGEIRIDDESTQGANTGNTTDIYGNIVVGAYAGISLLNNVTPASNWGAIKIYNNTFIDNKFNFRGGEIQNFNHVTIENNKSIINPDAESSCAHKSFWGSSFATWVWGANYWYGDNNPGSPFTTYGEWGTDPKLGKTSGWRSMTSMPSLSDFSPAIESIWIKIFNDEEDSLSPPVGLKIIN